ncbi:MAG: hypothetical protein B6243_10935 [Anaerolineaceae bacterium 4572_5.2]|nr:MAG: hypothetical protein B6243_10935 [Anaerolineaceae bacterium 4572_5.2]
MWRVSNPKDMVKVYHEAMKRAQALSSTQLCANIIGNMKPPTKITSFWHNQSVNTRLWFCLIASGLIYLAFTLAFPLARHYATIPPVDYAKLTRYSAFGFIAYVVGILALFAFYTLFLKLATGEKNSIRFIFGGGILFAFTLAFSYPQTAIDMFVYAIQSRGWALYGLMPLSISPSDWPSSDPWLGLAGEWIDTASPYGPVWEWLSLGTYHLSGGEYLAHLFVLKVLGVLAYIGSVWLLYRILLLIRPRWALAGAAFFAWNPLVLLESAQNAHNDITMMLLLLLAVWAFIKLLLGGETKRSAAYSIFFVAAFTAAILIKFIPLLILPFFLLAVAARKIKWSRQILSFVIYGLVSLLLIFLAMYPYWPGLDQWAVLYSGKSAGRSVMALLILALRAKVGTNAAFDYAQGIIYAILGGIYLWNLWRVWQQTARNKDCKNASDAETIIARVFLSSFYVLFWYVLIGVSTFHAWYLLWFLPFAALLIPKTRPMRAGLVFSMASLLIIPYYETIRVWVPALLHNHLLGHIIGVSLLVIPVLLTLRVTAQKNLISF